jgi:hypothetical protein
VFGADSNALCSSWLHTVQTLFHSLLQAVAAGNQTTNTQALIIVRFPKPVLVPQEGKVPRTQVKLSGGDVLTVDSLAGVVQLNALRSFLADGFQTHLQVPFCMQM